MLSTKIALNASDTYLCTVLTRYSYTEISWLDAEGWASKGGSEIGTNRGLPSEDLETVAFVFQKYNIQALFVVGGKQYSLFYAPNFANTLL